MTGVASDTRRSRFQTACGGRRGNSAATTAGLITCLRSALRLTGVICALIVASSSMMPAAAIAQNKPPATLPEGTPTSANAKQIPSIANSNQIPSTAISGQLPSAADSDQAPSTDQPIVDIQIEGNSTIPASAIKKYVKTLTGRPVSEDQVRDDLRSLYSTRWFFSVEPRYRQTDEGVVLVFRVVERPMLRSVEYRGNSKIKTKDLASLTGLKKEGPYDVSTNREAVRRIEAHYLEKGFPFAEVELLKGDDKDDRDVVFLIKEGPKTVVSHIKFSGNEFFNGPLLKTKLRTKTAILGLHILGGKYNPTTIPDDIAAVKQYYHNLGFFDVKIDKKVTVDEVKYNPLRKGHADVTIEYIIDEGVRYKLRNVEIVGNRVLSEDELRAHLDLKEGEPFNARLLNADVEEIQDKYGEMGRLFARVDAVPRFLEEPGVVDLVYEINEDRVYQIRRINVHIQGDHPHTREATVLNRIVVQPGDLADHKKIKLSESRLEGQIFERGQGQGPRAQVSRVEEQADSDLVDSIVRGQSGDPVFPYPPNPITGTSPKGDVFDNALREPPGAVDLDFYVTEARTGRLMFGVGVNSNAGVVGSIVLEENNFDIMRPPTSLQDILNGTAWRGDGQRFRIEAVPGTIVSRYLASWSDPYFLDTDYSLGVSGFYFNRFYDDWDEQRIGGRISVGRQLTNEFSLSAALRLEDITISRPRTPSPPLLADSVGSNYLSSVRLSAAHDTRDSPFLPGTGHFVQSSYEQAFANFNYPRLELQANQYFTVYSRPDGGGRHIVSLYGEMGWTDSSTPIFERYYAGGFQSFRGFQFRGVSPRQMDVAIGGRWLMLASAQYQVPLTADENISAVAFVDSGTVENSVGVEDFRVSVGAGLRITVPAMGPAPIALDWAVPVAREDSDQTRLFSFYVGLTR
jgi:outer membrane protein insertion porin family